MHADEARFSEKELCAATSTFEKVISFHDTTQEVSKSQVSGFNGKIFEEADDGTNCVRNYDEVNDGF